jgi:hypothetical protein
MRYCLRLEPLVFSQSIWTTNLLLTNATMQMNTWPNIINILSFRYGPKYEWRIPSWFTTIQERQILVKKLAMNGILLISQFCSSLFSFCPTQGHPNEAFGTHSGTYHTIWIKEKFKQGTHSTCIFILLQALISIVWTSFYSSSTLTSTPYKAYY